MRVRLHAEVGNLKQVHGSEVARLRSNLDRQRDQFLQLQQHLDKRSAEWQDFRHKVVTRTVVKHIENSERKEKENEAQATSESLSSAGEYRRRKSGDLEDGKI